MIEVPAEIYGCKIRSRLFIRFTLIETIHFFFVAKLAADELCSMILYTYFPKEKKTERTKQFRAGFSDELCSINTSKNAFKVVD